MSLKDYFEMGRKSELEYERKQKSRTFVKKLTKPSPMSPAGLIMGLGVFYQIILPHIGVPMRFLSTLKRIVEVIRIDIKMVCKRFYGVNDEWEKYKQFDELARRGKR